MPNLTHGPARRSELARIALLAALAALAAPAGAATDAILVGQDGRPTIILRHVDKSPDTPAEARKLLNRLGRAALQLCGADPNSLTIVKTSVRHSRCWRESMARAVAQTQSPLVLALFRRMSAGREG